jgi:hypothetical protein
MGSVPCKVALLRKLKTTGRWLMICPKCSFEQADGKKECAKCGVVFEKYLKLGTPPPQTAAPSPEGQGEAVEQRISIRELLFEVEVETNPFYFGGRVLLFLVILVWGIKLILTPMGGEYKMSSFMHLINLPFHEAGHLVFRPLGQWMTSLGGTLGQLLMPLVCLAVFLLKARNAFGASVCLWWFGENFMDIAPYINDARALQLPLLGGNVGESSPYGFHDWEYILNEIGWIRYDHTLAQIADKTGALLILGSLAWGGYLLFRQFRNLDLK